MALDILSIPAMSADPKRLFSRAKITILDRRNLLGILMIQALECLKCWLGIVEIEGDEMEELFTVDDKKGKGRDNGDGDDEGRGDDTQEGVIIAIVIND